MVIACQTRNLASVICEVEVCHLNAHRHKNYGPLPEYHQGLLMAPKTMLHSKLRIKRLTYGGYQAMWTHAVNFEKPRKWPKYWPADSILREGKERNVEHVLFTCLEFATVRRNRFTELGCLLTTTSMMCYMLGLERVWIERKRPRKVVPNSFIVDSSVWRPKQYEGTWSVVRYWALERQLWRENPENF